MEVGAQITWVVDTTAPSVDFADVTDPRNLPVDMVTFTFDESVTGVGIEDLSLTRDGSGNLLTGGERVESGDNTTWTLMDLNAITSADGDYVLMLVHAGSEIVDAATNALETSAERQWHMDATPPTLQITAIAPNPRIQPVADATLTFSEPINDFVIGDLSLTRDGGANLLTTQALTSADNQAWTLDGLAGVTGVAGTYILAVVAGAAVADLAGNEMEVGAQITWDYGIGISGDITYDGLQEGTLTLEVFAGSAIAGEPLESHSLAGRATDYEIIMLQDSGTYSFRAFLDGGDGTYDAGEAVDAVSQLDVDLAGDTTGIDFELYDWTHAFDFAAGWHWISFPGPPLVPSFGEFQTAINGVVWGQGQQVASVAAGQIAYWVYCHGEKSADIRGLNPVTEDTALVADWNHFGVSANAVAPAVGGAYQSVVWTWKEGRFESVAPGDTLVPFKGYYVNVSIGTLLEVE